MSEPGQTTALDLLDFIRSGPSPFHVTAELVRRLRAGGFSAQAEGDSQTATAGKHYLVRDGTVVAWHQPPGALATTPVRIIAMHTDSPTLKVKPRPDTGTAGWRQVGVEVYGQPLWNSWLDRDLGLAGRLVLFDGSSVLVNVDRPLLRVPQLAPHLDREVNDRGLKLDPQSHLLPVWGLGDVRSGELIEFLAAEAGVSAAEVAAHDLVLHDVSAPTLIGQRYELLAAPRLDNLSSTHAGLLAFLRAAETTGSEDLIHVYAAFDHEEVGSTSMTGAAGPLLENVLRQISSELAAGEGQGTRTLAASRCLSVDAMNAVHPNYLEWHDPAHLAVPNGGPTLKVNANQHYASDAPGAAAWARACRQAGVPSQVFVSRNSVQCGSTLGPILAARLGIRTVDVGIPVLSMHSVRELCGAADPGFLVDATAAFLCDPT
ncbi:MAG: Aspartyl aminopeptidase [Dactylosporangium sp.]|jgi:aspartyl aminopeptidase|nr:Aspartyl aminopeptidase [Dactylosporangium sp.]